MGTNLVSEDALAEQFDIGIRLAERLRPDLGALYELDLGGGFAAPYGRAGERPRLDGLAGRLHDLLDAHLPGWRLAAPQVAFESGRYLVADSGSLLCRVVDVKQSKGQVYAVLDTGIHHLGGMAGLRRVPRIVPEVVKLTPPPAWPQKSSADGQASPTVLAGPLCTPLDTLGCAAEGATYDRGDLLAIPNVGAYGLTASLLVFLDHDPTIEVVVDGDEVVACSRLSLSRAVFRPAELARC